MTYAELLLLSDHYDDEKEFLGDGYFRLRQKDGQHYELAFLKADACGTTSVNPQITVEVIDKKLRAVSLLDLFSTPVRNISESEETEALLEQELAALVLKFKAAKDL